jgi:hypothetical protein
LRGRFCVAAYFADLRDKRGLGAGTPERSYYPSVAGLVTEREYTSAEWTALEQEGAAVGMSGDALAALLGNRTLDIHLNRDAMWTNVPTNVWAYTLGGYQVIKKWLSYREKEILGRALKPEEVAYVSEMVRRIAAILLLSPAPDANYEMAKAGAVAWKDGRPATA